MNTPIKTILAASVLALSSSAFAVDFYLENGTSNSAGGSQVTGTSTGLFNSMTYTYWSSTTLTDANNDNNFSGGDTFLSTGGTMKDNTNGIGNSDLEENQITSFNPSWSAGGTNPNAPSVNGFTTAWNLTFGFDNLAGKVAANGGFIYESGNIIMQYWDSYAGWVNVLDLNVTGGTNNGIGQSLDLFGNLSVINGGIELGSSGSGVTVNDLFVLADGTSFSDYLAIDPSFSINWDNDQNTSPFFVNGQDPSTALDLFDVYWETDEDGNRIAGSYSNTGNLAAQHDGSLRFNIPEPAPLALLALGLLGMAGVRKIKAS